MFRQELPEVDDLIQVSFLAVPNDYLDFPDRLNSSFNFPDQATLNKLELY